MLKFLKKTTYETVVSLAEMEAWDDPPFQRPLLKEYQADGVYKAATGKRAPRSDSSRFICDLQSSEAITGHLTIGHISNDKATYLIDGNHRRAAARRSGRTEFLCVIDEVWFSSLEDAAAYFLAINKKLKSANRSDGLLAYAYSSATELAFVRSLPFVRLNAHKNKADMTRLLSGWDAAKAKTCPPMHFTAKAEAILRSMDDVDRAAFSTFARLSYAAWGEPDSHMWFQSELACCMWFYRQTFVDRPSARVIALTDDQFVQLLSAVHDDAYFAAWCKNKRREFIAEMCGRMKAIFIRTISPMKGYHYPTAEWMVSHSPRVFLEAT